MPPGPENPFRPPHEPTLTDAQAVGKVLGAADQAAMEAVLGEETLDPRADLPTGGIELTRAEREELEGPDLREAIEVMGRENVHGPDDVEKMLGFRPREIPPLPFSRADLEYARDHDEMLVLRVDKDKQGRTLTMERLNEFVLEVFEDEDKGKLFFDADWYKAEPFFTEQPPMLSWAMVSKDLLPNSTSKTEDQQDQLLKDLSDQLKKNPSLKNTLRRRTPVEVAYDLALHYLATDERLAHEQIRPNPDSLRPERSPGPRRRLRRRRPGCQRPLGSGRCARPLGGRLFPQLILPISFEPLPFALSTFITSSKR